MSTPAIRTVGLTKRYGDVTAIEGVDVSVARGELYGFLGRNGAGKTTAIRLLLGMIRPTAGHAEVLGRRVGRRVEPRVERGGEGGLWSRVGHLVEAATAYPELTVRENLDVARQLQGLPDARSVDREIERLRLAPFADRRARTLSSGNLQRLALARALLHDPELIILDEPTVGLDPAGVVEVRDLLRSLVAERGVTIFMSSHILTEVERLATRVGVVHGGRLVAELSASELAGRRRRRLEVDARDLAAAEAALRGAGYATVRAASVGPLAAGPLAAGPLAAGPFGAGPLSAGSQHAGSQHAGPLFIDDPRAVDRPDDVARLLVGAGTPPTRLAVVQEDMETFFLGLTGEAEGGAP